MKKEKKKRGARKLHQTRRRIVSAVRCGEAETQSHLQLLCSTYFTSAGLLCGVVRLFFILIIFSSPRRPTILLISCLGARRGGGKPLFANRAPAAHIKSA